MEKTVTVATQEMRGARATPGAVHEAKRDLLAARIDYADMKKDRIKACDEAVLEALEWQQIA